jgi:hypothetical protein
MGDEANTTQQYRVLYRSWHYYVPGKNPLGESVLQYKEARRGQILPEDGEELRDEDIKRGLLHGGIEPYNSASAEDIGDGPDEEEVLEEDEMVNELVLWLRDAEPNVNDTIEASEGDPERARMLLKAENIVTGNDPRKGVVQGLTAVITRGAGE